MLGQTYALDIVEIWPFPTCLRLPLNLGGLAAQRHCCQIVLMFELKLLCCNCSTLRKGLLDPWEKKGRTIPKDARPPTHCHWCACLRPQPPLGTAPLYTSVLNLNISLITGSSWFLCCTLSLLTLCVCKADDHMCFAVEMCKHGEMASVVLYVTWYINNWETVVCCAWISDIDLGPHQCFHPASPPAAFLLHAKTLQ